MTRREPTFYNQLIMLLANWKRIIRSGFINFWRSSLVSISSVIVLTVALFVIGSLILAQAFLGASLDEIKAKVDLSVSFQPDATEAEILSLRKEILSLAEVKEAVYRSREEEYQDFKERNKDNALIMQSLEEVGNPLGARLNIQATDPSHYGGIVDFLRSDSALASGGRNIIYQINYKKASVDALTAIINVSRRVGLSLALFFVFISLVVTFNTISLTIHISREEISVMKLVGANNQYVRGPFIVEGILAGLFASILSLIFLYPATIWLRSATAGILAQVNLAAYYLDHFAWLALVLIVSGLLISVLASLMAVRKYLRL